MSSLNLTAVEAYKYIENELKILGSELYSIVDPTKHELEIKPMKLEIRGEGLQIKPAGGYLVDGWLSSLVDSKGTYDDMMKCLPEVIVRSGVVFSELKKKNENVKGIRIIAFYIIAKTLFSIIELNFHDSGVNGFSHCSCILFNPKRDRVSGYGPGLIEDITKILVDTSLEIKDKYPAFLIQYAPECHVETQNIGKVLAKDITRRLLNQRIDDPDYCQQLETEGVEDFGAIFLKYLQGQIEKNLVAEKHEQEKQKETNKKEQNKSQPKIIYSKKCLAEYGNFLSQNIDILREKSKIKALFFKFTYLRYLDELESGLLKEFLFKFDSNAALYFDSLLIWILCFTRHYNSCFKENSFDLKIGKTEFQEMLRIYRAKNDERIMDKLMELVDKTGNPKSDQNNEDFSCMLNYELMKIIEYLRIFNSLKMNEKKTHEEDRKQLLSIREIASQMRNGTRKNDFLVGFTKIGSLFDSIQWNETNKNSIRYKYGKKFNFKLYSNLKFLMKSKIFSKFLHENSDRTLLENSCGVIEKICTSILDNKTADYDLPEFDYLLLLSSLENDLNCLEHLVNNLIEIKKEIDSRGLDLFIKTLSSNTEFRFHVAYMFIQIGELSKDLSPLISRYNSEAKSFNLFRELGKFFRDSIKSTPHILGLERQQNEISPKLLHIVQTFDSNQAVLLEKFSFLINQIKNFTTEKDIMAHIQPFKKAIYEELVLKNSISDAFSDKDDDHSSEDELTSGKKDQKKIHEVLNERILQTIFDPNAADTDSFKSHKVLLKKIFFNYEELKTREVTYGLIRQYIKDELEKVGLGLEHFQQQRPKEFKIKFPFPETALIEYKANFEKTVKIINKIETYTAYAQKLLDEQEEYTMQTKNAIKMAIGIMGDLMSKMLKQTGSCVIIINQLIENNIDLPASFALAVKIRNKLMHEVNRTNSFNKLEMEEFLNNELTVSLTIFSEIQVLPKFLGGKKGQSLNIPLEVFNSPRYETFESFFASKIAEFSSISVEAIPGVLVNLAF